MRLRSSNIDKSLPTHLVEELEEMCIQLKKEIECPICLEPIEKGQLKISYCGHKYCKTCFSQIDKCCICRRPFKKDEEQEN